MGPYGGSLRGEHGKMKSTCQKSLRTVPFFIYILECRKLVVPLLLGHPEREPEPVGGAHHPEHAPQPPHHLHLAFHPRALPHTGPTLLISLTEIYISSLD